MLFIVKVPLILFLPVSACHPWRTSGRRTASLLSEPSVVRQTQNNLLQSQLRTGGVPRRSCVDASRVCVYVCVCVCVWWPVYQWLWLSFPQTRPLCPSHEIIYRQLLFCVTSGGNKISISFLLSTFIFDVSEKARFWPFRLWWIMSVTYPEYESTEPFFRET
jgi:hypothetical protein